VAKAFGNLTSTLTPRGNGSPIDVAQLSHDPEVRAYTNYVALDL
jgi:hypothetical protein